jgi:Aspartic acid proteinase inhibitor
MRIAILVVGMFVAQPGAFRDMPVTDKAAIAAADFAIETRSKKEKVALDKIVRAESQVVAGTNYRLLLSVRVDGGVRQAEVVVWQKLDQSRELTRWKWMGEVVKTPGAD